MKRVAIVAVAALALVLAWIVLTWEGDAPVNHLVFAGDSVPPTHHGLEQPPVATSPRPTPEPPVTARSNELPAPTAPRETPPVPVVRSFEEHRRAPVDKRGGDGGGRAASELEIASYAFETLDDDIEQCLQEWRKKESIAPTEVMLGFEIDANGLTRSWVEADAGVPFGVRTCFANAVYGLDWSHIVEKPAMLTNRYNLADAGR